MTFDSAGPADGVTFTPGGSAATITEAGTYLILPTVTPAAAGQFAVYLNGAPVAGGTLPNSGDTASGPVIVNAQAGDTVTVVNTDAAAATLVDAAAGAPNATLYIQSLATNP